MKLAELFQVHLEHRIAVKDKEGVVEAIECPQYGAGGAQRFAVIDAIDGDAPALPGGAEFDDPLGLMANEQQYAVKAVPFGEQHLMLQQRRAADFDEGLG